MQDSRKSLEREAHHLGVPWSPTTTDDQLARLIDQRKGELAMEPKKDPECFGLMWEAVGQSVCQTCSVKDRCLSQFALVRLPELRAQMGAKATMQGLAEETGVSVEALEVATQFAEANAGGAVAPKPKRTPALAVVPPQPEPEEVVLEEEEPEDGDIEGTGDPEVPETDSGIPPPPMEAEEVAEVPPPAEEVEVPPAPPAEEPVVAPAVAAPAKSKAKKEKKGKGKKKPANPPVTGSAQGASGPASKGKPHAQHAVAPVTAPDQAWQWGDHTWEARWARERERSPEIAELTPGTKVKRLYQGKEYVVQVSRMSYRYEEKEYPTLYSIVKVITGTKEYPAQMRGGKRPEGSRQLCNWSAIKFFNLRRSKKQKGGKKSK